MSETVFFASIALLVLGIGAFFLSDKDRNMENDEWPGLLQWAYLLVLIGAFGMLANFISLTAVLLFFTVFTFILWIKNKINQKHAKDIYDEKASGHFVDYMSGFFPIVLIVFVLRTFVAEPFIIPSSSMRPGLIPGDFVLVNKFSYGIRTPIINNVLLPIGEVERGDVLVFQYPADTNISFIKRIVALPGDVIDYQGKVLRINGDVVSDQPLGQDQFMSDPESGRPPMPVNVLVLGEKMGQHDFQVFQNPYAPTLNLELVTQAGKESCSYHQDGFSCTVPEGKYFAMGDNRDNSLDSRYWGFVDEKLIVGKAFLIWMNFGDFKRVGKKIQ